MTSTILDFSESDLKAWIDSYPAPSSPHIMATSPPPSVPSPVLDVKTCAYGSCTLPGWRHYDYSDKEWIYYDYCATHLDKNDLPGISEGRGDRRALAYAKILAAQEELGRKRAPRVLVVSDVESSTPSVSILPSAPKRLKPAPSRPVTIILGDASDDDIVMY